MEEKNLWEIESGNNFKYVNAFEEYLEYLTKEDRNLDFKIIGQSGETKSLSNMTPLEMYAIYDNLKLTFTDHNHKIAIAKRIYKDYINPKYYYENKDKIISLGEKYLIEKINSIKKLDPDEVEIVNIPDSFLTNNLVEAMCNDEYSGSKEYHIINSENIKIPEIYIEKLQESAIDLFDEYKGKISSKISFGMGETYSKKDLQNEKTIFIDLNNEKDKLKFLNYINENAIIRFYDGYGNKVGINEDSYFKKIDEALKELSSHNRKYNVNIKVKNRAKFKNSKLLDNIPSNINLVISSGRYVYKVEEYKEEEEFLENLVKDIKESKLSNLEKYTAVYDIVKKYKKYKENEADLADSRDLNKILHNEYMVCVGFATLLNDLLLRVGIPNMEISVEVDDSYRGGFTLEEKAINKIGHARNLIYLKDEKYNVDGYYISDATWDNQLETDQYLNCLLTHNTKKAAKNYETLTDEDLLLDFNNEEEFNDKINFYLRRNINDNTNYLFENSTTSIDPKIKYKIEIRNFYATYEKMYKKIMDILSRLDEEKYTYFYNKFNEKIQEVYDNKFKDVHHQVREEYDSENVQKTDQIMREFLSDYRDYILPKVNNEISVPTIIVAAKAAKEKLYNFSEEELNNWFNNTISYNVTKIHEVFPYMYKDYYEKEKMRF